MLIFRSIKGIVHPQKLTYPQAIQDVDEFVPSLETDGSSAVNGSHQNESPNSW